MAVGPVLDLCGLPFRVSSWSSHPEGTMKGLGLVTPAGGYYGRVATPGLSRPGGLTCCPGGFLDVAVESHGLGRLLWSSQLKRGVHGRLPGLRIETGQSL